MDTTEHGTCRYPTVVTDCVDGGCGRNIRYNAPGIEHDRRLVDQDTRRMRADDRGTVYANGRRMVQRGYWSHCPQGCTDPGHAPLEPSLVRLRAGLRQFPECVDPRVHGRLMRLLEASPPPSRTDVAREIGRAVAGGRRPSVRSQARRTAGPATRAETATARSKGLRRERAAVVRRTYDADHLHAAPPAPAPAPAPTLAQRQADAQRRAAMLEIGRAELDALLEKVADLQRMADVASAHARAFAILAERRDQDGGQ